MKSKTRIERIHNHLIDNRSLRHSEVTSLSYAIITMWKPGIALEVLIQETMHKQVETESSKIN